VILHLGVLDVGYTEGNKTTTTGDVAEILEDNYHVMRSFVEIHEDEIADDLAKAMAGVLESKMSGWTPDFKLPGAMSSIENRFRSFLSAGEMQKLLPATQPIKAAEAGISHRKKHPYAKKNKARVAFVDTGLYRQSFRSWVD
jgi:hypothetical protein